MAVLVTGGTGFIGSALVEALVDAGFEVRTIGLVRHQFEKMAAARLAELDVEFIEGDLVRLTQESREESTEIPSFICGVDTIFHLAASQHEMGIPDSRFIDVNVEASCRLFEMAASAGVTRFVYGSSIGVYGEGASHIDEVTPTAPKDIYQSSKLEAERALQAKRQQLDSRTGLTIIRISETYGPGDSRLLKLFSMIDKGMPVMFGTGKNLHHPIYVGDLVSGLMAAAANSAADGETLLLAGPKPIDTSTMITDVAAVLDRKPPSMRLPLWPFLGVAWLLEMCLRPLGIDPPLHRRRMDFFLKEFAIDCRKAKEVLDFQARTEFRHGARITADWYRTHGMLKSKSKNGMSTETSSAVVS